jgi:hypothetical protein
LDGEFVGEYGKLSVKDVDNRNAIGKKQHFSVKHRLRFFEGTKLFKYGLQEWVV